MHGATIDMPGKEFKLVFQVNVESSFYVNAKH